MHREMWAPIPAVASTTSPKAVVERSSASDMREKAAALLQAVRDKNTETYTATAKKKHFDRIAKLQADLDARDAKIARSKSRSAKTGTSGTAIENPVRTKYSAEDCKRLIYARTHHNTEFLGHIQTALEKTDCMARSYNGGFTLKKELIVGGDEDVVFAALPANQHKSGLPKNLAAAETRLQQNEVRNRGAQLPPQAVTNPRAAAAAVTIPTTVAAAAAAAAAAVMVTAVAARTRTPRP